MFQFLDAIFVRADDRVALSIDNPVQQRFDFAFDFDQFGFEGPRHVFGRCDTVVPDFTKHGLSQFEQARHRAQRLQKRREFPFQHIPAYGLSVALTATLGAMIIGVAFGASLRPAGGERRVAARAYDCATQRKIRIEIFARGCLGVAVQALLNLLKYLIADQRLVPAFAQADAPWPVFDVTGIDALVENVGDTLIAHIAIAVARKAGMHLKKAHHFRLNAKSPRGEALQRFTNDGGVRLVRDKHLSTGLDLFVSIADRSLKHEEPVTQP